MGTSTNKKRKKRQRKGRIRRSVFAAILVVVVGGVFIGKTVVEHWSYSKYEVLQSSTQEDTQSASYIQLSEKLLKVTTGGAALLGTDGKSIWTQSYEMNNPMADVCENTAVIYDEKGTTMMVADSGGKLGTISTQLPILKARVASQGVVAAILEDGEDTWINFYSAKGEEIATGKTRIDSPGYPVDLSVSPNGLLIMVSYLYMENGKTTSYVAFYNFGNTGQSQMDNIVSGYTYENTVVPQVRYLSEGKAVGFKDNGFVIYTGSQIPEVSKEVNVDQEIISTCYNEDYIGMVFRSDDKDKKYTLALYNTKGALKFSTNFNIEYTTLKISDNQILMYNDTQLAVYNVKGYEKFNGNLEEGNILNAFRVGYNRYQVVTDGGIRTIKLK